MCRLSSRDLTSLPARDHSHALTQSQTLTDALAYTHTYTRKDDLTLRAASLQPRDVDADAQLKVFLLSFSRKDLYLMSNYADDVSSPFALTCRLRLSRLCTRSAGGARPLHPRCHVTPPLPFPSFPSLPLPSSRLLLKRKRDGTSVRSLLPSRLSACLRDWCWCVCGSALIVLITRAAETGCEVREKRLRE